MTDSFGPFNEPFRSALLIQTGDVSDFRLDFAARALKAAGWEVVVTKVVQGHMLSRFDVIVFSRPYPSMVDMVKTTIDAGVTVVIDMDDDFYSIPPSSPAYRFLGKEAPDHYHRKLDGVVKTATQLVYASPELANRYHREGAIIPNGWDETNPMWAGSKLPKGRDYLTVGWAGTITHRQDMMECHNAVCLVMEENPNLHLVIGGDPDIVKMFSTFFEQKRAMFVYGQMYETYPVMLQFMDIWMAPLQDTFFNRAKSDVKLVEAGARGIPWLASSLPQYLDWHEGGLICRAPSDWYINLSRLVHEPALRDSLGATGYVKAMTRTAAVLGQKWVSLLDKLVEDKRGITL